MSAAKDDQIPSSETSNDTSSLNRLVAKNVYWTRLVDQKEKKNRILKIFRNIHRWRISGLGYIVSWCNIISTIDDGISISKSRNGYDTPFVTGIIVGIIFPTTILLFPLFSCIFSPSICDKRVISFNLKYLFSFSPCKIRRNKKLQKTDTPFHESRSNRVHIPSSPDTISPFPCRLSFLIGSQRSNLCVLQPVVMAG